MCPFESSAPPDPAKAIYDEIVSIERDFAAHQLTIGDVRIWSAMRLQIAESLMLALGILNRPIARRISRRSRINALPENLILRNPFLKHGTFPNFVMKWERSQQTDNGLQDVITQPLRDLLPPEDTRYTQMLGAIPSGYPADLSFEAVAMATKARAAISPSYASRLERDGMLQIQQAIEDRLGVRMDLVSKLTKGAAEFRAQRDVFIRLFRHWRVRRLFVVVAYARASLVAAAKACGATTIELQHGLIHRSHFGYDFPEGLEPAYRPDILLLYGDYWRNAARHYAGTRLEVFGAPYLDRHLKSANPVPHGQREAAVLFISQAGIFKNILEFALEFSRQPNIPRVILRLHPADDINAVDQIVSQAMIDREKFEISTGGGGGQTLSLQARCAFQVGAFSTALLEGAALGCKTYLIPAPGWSALSGMLDAQYAQFASSPAALARAIQFPNTLSSTDVIGRQMFCPARPAVIEDILRD